MNRIHDSIIVPINGENVEIDSEIVSLIESLNSMDDVETLFCCQGDEGEIPFPEGYAYPYVALRIYTERGKKRINNLLKDFSDSTGEIIYCSEDYTFPTTQETFNISFMSGKMGILKFQEFVLSKNIKDYDADDIVVVCLCGSTRFKDTFLTVAKEEAIRGKIVLMPELFSHSEGISIDIETQNMFDKVHRRKIDLSDEVYILNVNGYIGNSTMNELDYARKNRKTIRFLETDKEN